MRASNSLLPTLRRFGLVRELLSGFLIASLLLPAQAVSPPLWWAGQGIIDSGKSSDDYAVINQGQLKNLVKAAVAEMNARLPGGAGTGLNGLVSSWANAVEANDFAAVNAGQLKSVAKVIYDRLLSTGVISALPEWSTDSSAGNEDFAVANIGQAKNLFSFFVPDKVTDSDGDGFTDFEERADNKDPNDPLDHPSLPPPAYANLPPGSLRSWPFFEDYPLYDGVYQVGVAKSGCMISKKFYDPSAGIVVDPVYNRYLTVNGGFEQYPSGDSIVFLPAPVAVVSPGTLLSMGGGATSSIHYAPEEEQGQYYESKSYSRADLFIKPLTNYSVSPPRTTSHVKLFIQSPVGTPYATPGSTGIKQYMKLPSIPLEPDGSGGDGYKPPNWRIANSTLFGNPPSGKFAESLQPGQSYSASYVWQEIPLDIQSFSLSDSAGPRYRKIGLNGFPLSDNKPQSQDESGELPEETYVDAYSRQLRHSVSDVYVTTESTMMPLQVRRNTASESWSRRFGLTIEERMDRPFGPGWTSNLSPLIRFEGSGPVNTSTTYATQAIVTDEQGGQRTFLKVKDQARIWCSSREQTQDAKTLFDRFVELTDGRFVLYQKYGTTCFYERVLYSDYQRLADQKVNFGFEKFYAYARLVEVRDRLGNRLLYQYPSSAQANVIPHVIYDPDRPAHRISIQQDQGMIVKIQGADGETTHYEYETVISPGEAPLPASFKVLKRVSRSAPGQPAPETGGIVYGYDIDVDHDPTPASSDGIQTEYVHVDLNQLTDERSNSYFFNYRDPATGISTFDRGWEYEEVTGDPQNLMRTQMGLPRLLRQIVLPDTKVVNLTGNRGARISLEGVTSAVRASTTVSGDCGTFHYIFGDPVIFRPYIRYRNGNVEFLTHQRVMSFSKLDLYHGSVAGGTTPKETFEFEPSAGLALKKVTDLSGKITKYAYNDIAYLHTPTSSSGTLAQAMFFDDPNVETSAIHGKKDVNNKAIKGQKFFGYDPETRVMTSMTDENGVKTTYVLQTPVSGQPATGLRIKETVSDTKVKNATKKILRVTKYEYGHPKFKGFKTKQVLEMDGLPVGNSAIGKMVTSFSPDINGRIRSLSVELGDDVNLVTRYTYTNSGSKKTVTDPRHLTTSFDYEPDSLRLRKVTNAEGSTKQISYDAHGNIVHEINEIGVTTFYDYDELNRRTKTTIDLNGNGLRDSRYVPAPANGSALATYNGDIVTETTYNAFNLPNDEISATGVVTRHLYDDLGRRTQTTVNHGASNSDLIHVTKYVDDDPETEDFVGGSVFDISGFKPKQVTDTRGFVTRFEYDDLYRVTKKTLTDTRYSPEQIIITKTEYDPVGNAVAQIDPLGRRTAIVYDGLRRPVKVIHPWDAQTPAAFTETFYTPGSQVWKTIDEMGSTVAMFYDNAGREIQKVMPPVLNHATQTLLSPVTYLAYDGNGNVIESTDALGNVVKTIYDSRNRPWKILHPPVMDAQTGLMKRPETITSYDAAGRTTGTTDPLGNFTETKYDRAGRVLQVIGPPIGLQTHITTSTYDAAGNVLTVTNAEDQTVTNVYDAHNRLTKTTDAALIENHFLYDKAGNRTLVSDGLSQESLFDYDAQNRLLSQEFANHDSWTYGYDKVNKTSQKDAKNVTTFYGYDARNRLKTLTAPDIERIMTYDKAGRLTKVTETGRPQALVSNSYDAIGWLRAETSQGVTHTYGYDLAGNRVNADYGTGRTVAIAYDALNRPSTISEDGRITSYGYDLAGRALVLIAGNGQATENVYDALGRLTGRKLFASATERTDAGILAEFGWGHDAIGNVTAHSEQWKANVSRPAGLRSTSMLYDEANRLTTETINDPASGITMTAYTYDKANNRESKTVAGGSEPGYWHYVYNEANQLESWAKYDEPDGTLLKSGGLAYDGNGNRTSLNVVDQTVSGTHATLANQGITYQARTAGATGENLSVSLVAGETLGVATETDDHVVVTLEAGVSTVDTLVNQGITYTTLTPHQTGNDITVSLLADAPGQSPSVEVDGHDIQVFLGTSTGAQAAASDQGITYTAITAGAAGNAKRIRLEKGVPGQTLAASTDADDIVVRLETDNGTPDKLENQGIIYTASSIRAAGEEVSVSLMAEEPNQTEAVEILDKHIKVQLGTNAGKKASAFAQGLTYTANDAGVNGNDLRIVFEDAATSQPMSAEVQGDDIVVKLEVAAEAIRASKVLSGVTYEAVESGSPGNGIIINHIMPDGPNQPVSVSVGGSEFAKEINVHMSSNHGDYAKYETPGMRLTSVLPGTEGNEISFKLEDPGDINQSISASVDDKFITVRLATDGNGEVISNYEQVLSAISGVAGHLVTVQTLVGSLDIAYPMQAILYGGGENYDVACTPYDIATAIAGSPEASALVWIPSPVFSPILAPATGELRGGLPKTYLKSGAEIAAFLNADGNVNDLITVTYQEGEEFIIEPVTLLLSGGGGFDITSTADSLVEMLDGNTAVEELLTVSGFGEEPLETLGQTELNGGEEPASITTAQEVVDLLNDEMDDRVIVTLTGDPEVEIQPGIVQLYGGGNGFTIQSTASQIVTLLNLDDDANDLITASGSGDTFLTPLTRTVLTGGAPQILSTATQVIAALSDHPLLNVTGSGTLPLSLMSSTHLSGVTGTTLNTAYFWNAQDRLTGVTMPDGSRHTYTYDHRVRRVQTSRSGGAESPLTTAIVFAGGLSLAEYESSSGAAFAPETPTVHYVRGPDMGGGVGGMLYSVREGSTVKYSLSNGRGDIVAQSDQAAALTWTASYEAYGKRPAETGTNLDKQRANSKDEDPTGLLNEGWRYRDLETGTWMSRDPAGFVDGPNLYAYVQQNPWSKFDAEGMFWSAIVTAGFAAYDTYQYATGNISGADYAGRMALNGAALVADAASGGMGGGLAVRMAATGSRAVTTVIKTAKAVDKANDLVENVQTAVETGQSIVEASEGEGRGLVRAAANALEDAATKKVLGAKNGGAPKRIPLPDGGFTADLSKTKAKSRSGHSYAGNKQLHEEMQADPVKRAEMEAKFGDDVMDRTSTSNGGRKNPKDAEWDHNTTDQNALDLRSKDNHRQKTRSEGQSGGGWRRFQK